MEARGSLMIVLYGNSPFNRHTPVQTEGQALCKQIFIPWIPACAGMTIGRT